MSVPEQDKHLSRSAKQGVKAQPRLSALLTIVFILLVTFLLLTANSPEGRHLLFRWQAQDAQQQLKQVLANDPAVGFDFAAHSDRLQQFANSQKPLFLIVFGGCEGCGAQSLSEWADILGNWQTWRKELSGVLVIRDKTEKVKEAVVKGKWKVSVIADEDGDISKMLNAVFSPRAYGFVDGKLLWLQKEPSMGIVSVLESFLTAVKSEEAAKELLNEWSKEMRERLWGKEAAALTRQGGERR